MNDIYYYTPRIPAFFMMEDFNPIRVVSVRFKDGKMDAVLGEWDADIISSEFHTQQNWNSQYENIFYYLEKGEEGFLLDGTKLETYINSYLLKEYGITPQDKEWAETYNNVLEDFYEDIEKLHIPILTKEEAREYIFKQN